MQLRLNCKFRPYCNGPTYASCQTRSCKRVCARVKLEDGPKPKSVRLGTANEINAMLLERETCCRHGGVAIKPASASAMAFRERKLLLIPCTSPYRINIIHPNVEVEDAIPTTNDSMLTIMRIVLEKSCIAPCRSSSNNRRIVLKPISQQQAHSQYTNARHGHQAASRGGSDADAPWFP